jgi:hypothetical protein
VKRDDLTSRVAARIKDGLCWASEDPIEVFEDAKEGEARVTCTASAESLCLVFRLDRVGFPFLRPQKSVDWLLLVHLPDGSLDAHLVECKRKVNAHTWSDVKSQMAASVLRSFALVGALNATIRRFYGYTAYRHDNLAPSRSPDPIFARLPIGSGVVAGQEATETREARLGQMDWESPEILLQGVEAPITHRRVQLDQASGKGQTALIAT